MANKVAISACVLAFGYCLVLPVQAQQPFENPELNWTDEILSPIQLVGHQTDECVPRSPVTGTCCEVAPWDHECAVESLFSPDTWCNEMGVEAHGSFTQFYQGVASGGAEQRFRYGGKLDLYLKAETSQLGLWKGGELATHIADWQIGQSANPDAAGLAPANTAMLTPLANQPSFAITSLNYTQQLGQGWAALAGRINFLDLWEGLYPEYGRGVHGFMNLSTMLPLSVVPSVPLITNGAGILKAGERGVEFMFLVTEGQFSPTTVGMDFPNGVTLIAIGRKYSDFWGKPGSHTLAATYGTGEFTSFDERGWVINPGGVVPAQQTGTWAAAYLGEQRLWTDPCHNERYTKLFGYVGLSDTKTSPFAWTSSVSVETFGPLQSRPEDRAGIAYFYSSLNSDFQNLVSLIDPIGDVHGGEVYYNAAITSLFRLTFDMQAIRPEVSSRDTALVLGIRGELGF